MNDHHVIGEGVEHGQSRQKKADGTLGEAPLPVVGQTPLTLFRQSAYGIAVSDAGLQPVLTLRRYLVVEITHGIASANNCWIIFVLQSSSSVKSLL
jgi:hypothetical protein